MQSIKWLPSQDIVNSSQVHKFIVFINQRFATNIQCSDELHEWSIANIQLFWSSFWEFSGLKASKKWEEILINSDDMINAKWFVGSQLNYAENLLSKNNDDLAMVFRNEKLQESRYSFKDLHRIVSGLVAYLKKLGVKKGDVVCGYLPNLPETVMAMLATTAIGAVWTSCSPDFGIEGALDRLGQTQPQVLFAVDGYFYNGKEYNCHDKIIAITKRLSTLKKTIIIQYAQIDNNINQLSNTVHFNEIIANAKDMPIEFEQVEFGHPLFIMYSSGTTGKPKCIVHGVGGTLIQHLKEHILHTNVIDKTKIFFYTTCGWMMWNWQVSSLAVGATLMLYDGAPILESNKGILLDYVDDHNINIFGVSAKYISTLEKSGYRPIESNRLNSLVTILSTGSPLLPENYDYVYSKIKPDLRLSSISGGTDIISCFALGDPTKPVYSGELQQLGFGLDVRILTDDGKEVEIGEKGELSCVQSFPSQPIYFLNDENKHRYFQSYFSKVKNVWCHGDYASKTKHHGLVIYGRSDTTLNPGGIRIGTAEIYMQVEAIEAINEAVVVGKEDHGEVLVILFVTLQPNWQLDEKLITEIKQKIRVGASPHHVPAKIIQVPGIPKTINGKVVELAVKNAISGNEVKNIEILANPESLEFYKNLNL